MKVSVFTPFHLQDVTYLKESYESLLKQTHQDWEWVLVLNGNALKLKTDKELSFIKDKRVNIFSTVKTGFIGAVKNYACNRASGDSLVVAEMDYDDILTPDCLEEVNKAFEDENIHMVYSNCAEFENGTWKPHTYSEYWGWKMRPFIYRDGEIDRPLVEMVSWLPSAQMMRRIEWAPNHIRAWRKSSYDEIGGHDKELKVGDDHDLCCRFYIKYGDKGIKLIDKCLYIYRVHPSNNVKLLNAEIQAQTDKNYNKYCRAMAERWARDNNLLTIHLSSVLKNEDNKIKAWDIGDNSVGVISAKYALEHLENPIHAMNEAYRVLAGGGFLFIEVPSTDGRGAFQHPSHKSFFNENSFQYYTNESFAVKGYTGKFQVSKLITWYPSDFEKEKDIKITQADLICVKDFYHERHVGEVLWKKPPVSHGKIKEETNTPTVRIKQIYFEDSQKQFLDSGFIPLKNDVCGKYMENLVIKSLWELKDYEHSDYYGVLSWRFQKKMDLSSQDIEKHMQSDNFNSDVYNFHGEDRTKNIFLKDDAFHNGKLSVIANFVFEKQGYKDILSLKTPLIYCNYWIAKKEVFNKYVEDILIPAIDLMENDIQINKLANENSGYFEYLDREEYRPENNRTEKARGIFGVPYYTFHPFICERLMSVFLALNPDLKLKTIR